MAYDIPDESLAVHGEQATLFSTDVDALIQGFNREGVISGCAVTAQSPVAMAVDVAIGVIRIGGGNVNVAAGVVNITAADATRMRVDIIVINNAGAKSVVDGTWDATDNPLMSAIPANSVLLAGVFVPAGATTITAEEIIDKRVFLGALQAGDIPDVSATYQVVSEKAAASGYASLDGSTKVVENPANATATPTAGKIPIAGGTGKLAAGWIQEVLAYADLTDDPYADHSARHENGGADEISVAGLSGELADNQPPKSHASSHQNGGGDEVATATPGANAIPKAGAGGKLAAGWLQEVLAYADLTDDPYADHSARHENTGADEINVGGLSGALADNQPSDHATPIAAHADDDDAHHALVTIHADLNTKLLSLSTQELDLDTQAANKLFAGPASGGAAKPTFRDLVDADLSLAMLKSLLTTRGDMIRRGASIPERFAKGTSGKFLKMGANDPDWQWAEAAIEYVIDGGGSAISTGLAGGLEVPFDCFVTGWTIGATDGNTGAMVVDVWKDTYANFPPTVAGTIAGSEKPTITATGNKGQDLTLTTWTQALTKGDWLFFNVDSVATLERVTVSLRVDKYRAS